ncbi:putative transcriptional regulatory protein [Colletotrichum fructicola]|nr:putative transcriptional regulatory protein [Colletotrichum fructicola]KAF4901244.1 putative transcriptional regulatory protein [Colletotrichum fructicola]KAF4922648.1 putative transcriptional regulatory protein [Colletotrichum fructicola]
MSSVSVNARNAGAPEIDLSVVIVVDCVYGEENPRQRSLDSEPHVEPDASSREATTTVLRRLSILDNKMENVTARLSTIEDRLTSLLDLHLSGSVQASHAARNPRNGTDAPNLASNQGQSVVAEQEAPAPMDVGVPEDVVAAAVDAYFFYCHNQPYSFFHEAHFRRRLSERTVPTHLLLTIVATAGRFCSHPYFTGRVHEASVDCANRAWKLIVSDCFTEGTGTEISAVQTVALLGLFDFTAGRSRHGSAWVKVGMSVRMAQDCGLMLENATHLPYMEQEERRRVFWSVYLLDRLVSCGRGRPPAIVDASCHLQLPCEEVVWKNEVWSKTQSLDEMTNRALTVPQSQGSFAHVIAMAQILGRSAQYMLQEFNIRSPHPPWDRSSDFAALESDLLHFESSLRIQQPLQQVLAPYISADGVVDYHTTGPIIFSRAFYHLCYCLLNHPFLLKRRIDTCRTLAPTSFLTRSSDLGWLHAQHMLALIRDARGLGCSFHSSSSGYCATVAGSIIALRTGDSDLAVSQRAQVLLEEALSYLDTLGRHWNNVSSMATVLRRMVYDGFLGGSLCSSELQRANITLAEEETLWAVVDYNTMSSTVSEEALNNNQDLSSIWLDSWTDLFGVSGDQIAPLTPNPL